MRTYRFTVTVSETGMILLPAETTLKGKEVEVVITPRAGKRKAKGRARAFAEKWAGFLKPADDGDARYDHLMDKHA